MICTEKHVGLHVKLLNMSNVNQNSCGSILLIKFSNIKFQNSSSGSQVVPCVVYKLMGGWIDSEIPRHSTKIWTHLKLYIQFIYSDENVV